MQSTFGMENKETYLESIHEIRSIMERSSKFLSLSGLSGVAAGVTALISGIIAFVYLDYSWSYLGTRKYLSVVGAGYEHVMFFVYLALATLFVAVVLAFAFTQRNAKRKGLKMWDKTAKLLMFNMAVPLVTGGILILILVFHYDYFVLASPMTLLFYGLALFNGSKYTVSDTRWLGLAQVALGLVSFLYIGYGLLFWIFGFGVCHIIYGIVLYLKYERKKA